VRDLLAGLMDSAALHADYADVRHVRREGERIRIRNGALEQAARDGDEGIGVRVRLGGAWGFAATAGAGRAGAEAALERALAVAREQPRPAGGPPQLPLALAPEPPARGEYASPVEIDPFAVALDDKLAPLASAEGALRAERGVSVATADFHAFRTETTFASTEGALCAQRLTECGGGIAAVATDAHDAQVRSYPGSHGGSVAQAGFEHFLGLPLEHEAPRVAAEAVALLTAPACPDGPADLVLAGEQLALQVHESVGHAVELDRVLGREASYAGTSWVAAGDAGATRYGSEPMSVTADATGAGGLGSFRWDDEGVAAQAIPIVRAGLLAGFLSSRETAAETGRERSGGCMRAEGFARQPLVRMTNVNLDPGGAGTLADLLADTERGIYVDTNRSWSIDDRRLRFRFEGEAAYEIRSGERGRLLKNPSYEGVTPEFWGALDAVCSASEWALYGVLNCGKGEPGQIMRVSHGVAPARFRGVAVGGRR
jgi:TldD protein